MSRTKSEPRIPARTVAPLQDRLRGQAAVQFRTAAELSLEAADRIDVLEGAFLGLVRATKRFGAPTPPYLLQLARHLDIPLDGSVKAVPLPVPDRFRQASERTIARTRAA